MKLPRKMHFKNGGYYYVHANKWLFLSRDQKQALDAYAEAIGISSPKYVSSVYDRARKNASYREIPFELTRPEFQSLVQRADGRCEVSGISFSPVKVATSKRRPWAPSLDRIDSSLPYTVENCRLVCVAVNAALSDWGYEVLLRTAKAVVFLDARRKIRQRRKTQDDKSLKMVGCAGIEPATN